MAKHTQYAPPNNDVVIATNRLITTVGDLAMQIRQLCNRADISTHQRQALTEAHKWLAEFGIEQHTYDDPYLAKRKEYRNGNRK